MHTKALVEKSNCHQNTQTPKDSHEAPRTPRTRKNSQRPQRPQGPQTLQGPPKTPKDPGTPRSPRTPNDPKTSPRAPKDPKDPGTPRPQAPRARDPETFKGVGTSKNGCGGRRYDASMATEAVATPQPEIYPYGPLRLTLAIALRTKNAKFVHNNDPFAMLPTSHSNMGVVVKFRLHSS